MIGAQWRVIALVLAFGWALRCWIVVDSSVGVANAVLWTAVAVRLACIRLRERPRCGFRLPVLMADRKSTHNVHHCAGELGHISDQHECRCGLGYVPLEVRR